MSRRDPARATTPGRGSTPTPGGGTTTPGPTPDRERRQRLGPAGAPRRTTGAASRDRPTTPPAPAPAPGPVGVRRCPGRAASATTRAPTATTGYGDEAGYADDGDDVYDDEVYDEPRLRSRPRRGGAPAARAAGRRAGAAARAGRPDRDLRQRPSLVGVGVRSAVALGLFRCSVRSAACWSSSRSWRTRRTSSSSRSTRRASRRRCPSGVAATVGLRARAPTTTARPPIPLVLVLSVAVCFLWYLVGAGGERPGGQHRRHPARRRLDRRCSARSPRCSLSGPTTASPCCSAAVIPTSPTTSAPCSSGAAPGRDPCRRPAPTRRSRAWSAACCWPSSPPSCSLVLGVHPFDELAARASSSASLVAARGAARRPGRVAGQARPRHQGHGQRPPGPRRRARPVRRPALRAAGRLLPGPHRSICRAPLGVRQVPVPGRRAGDGYLAVAVTTSPSPGPPARSAPRPSTSCGPSPTASRSSRSAPGRRSTTLVAQAHERAARRWWSSPTPRGPPSWPTRVPPGTEVRAGADGAGRAGRRSPTCASTGWSASPACPSRWPRCGAGERLALANKESLIAGGPVVQPARRTPGAELVPVDSEHCAVHQCLAANAGGEPGRVAAHRAHRQRRARSGAARRAELADVTVDDALAHPTWSMGPKITVDSSTLMNKGLEVIEAHELFGDAYGVGYDRDRGRRAPPVDRPLDGRAHRRLHHRPALDARHAPADRLRPGLARPHRHARSGASTGRRSGRSTSSRPTSTPSPASAWPTRPGGPAGLAPAVLNAANEVAVEAFLDGRIRWVGDPRRPRRRCSPGMMEGEPTGRRGDRRRPPRPRRRPPRASRGSRRDRHAPTGRRSARRAGRQPSRAAVDAGRARRSPPRRRRRRPLPPTPPPPGPPTRSTSRPTRPAACAWRCSSGSSPSSGASWAGLRWW